MRTFDSKKEMNRYGPLGFTYRVKGFRLSIYVMITNCIEVSD